MNLPYNFTKDTIVRHVYFKLKKKKKESNFFFFFFLLHSIRLRWPSQFFITFYKPSDPNTPFALLTNPNNVFPIVFNISCCVVVYYRNEFFFLYFYIFLFLYFYIFIFKTYTHWTIKVNRTRVRHMYIKAKKFNGSYNLVV